MLPEGACPGLHACAFCSEFQHSTATNPAIQQFVPASKFSIPLDLRAGRRASLSVAETLPLMTQRTSWVRKQAYWNAMRCIDVWHHYLTTRTIVYLYFVVSSIDVRQCIHLKVRWEWASESAFWLQGELHFGSLHWLRKLRIFHSLERRGIQNPTFLQILQLNAWQWALQYTNVTKAGCPSWSFLCFSSGAEVGQLIDFITQKGGGLMWLNQSFWGLGGPLGVWFHLVPGCILILHPNPHPHQESVPLTWFRPPHRSSCECFRAENDSLKLVDTGDFSSVWRVSEIDLLLLWVFGHSSDDPRIQYFSVHDFAF